MGTVADAYTNVKTVEVTTSAETPDVNFQITGNLA
jgi:hypothetical protein